MYFKIKKQLRPIFIKNKNIITISVNKSIYIKFNYLNMYNIL